MIKIKIVFLFLTIGLIAWFTGYDKGKFSGNKAHADAYEWFSNPMHPLSPYNPLNPGSPLYENEEDRDSYDRNPVFAIGLEIHRGRLGMIYNHNEFWIKVELFRPLLFWNLFSSTKIIAPKSSAQYGKILRTDKLYVYKKDSNGEFKKFGEIKLCQSSKIR